jgi:selenium metabolism protein YedF
MKTIDCRNLACPAPVINVKKALEENTELQVILDDGAPRENVTRFCRNRGYKVEELHEGMSWKLTITASPDLSILRQPKPSLNDRTVLITSDRIGDGPEELGRLLMKNFIHTLLETSEIPSRIFFLNTGVFLTCEGSDVCEALDKLIGMGVEIFSCGMCLDFFKLKEKLCSGATTNMLTIAENLLGSSHVIKL